MVKPTLFKRTTPEAEGLPSSAVLDFLQALEHGFTAGPHPLDAVQGFMLLRHGHVAAEGWWAPYGPQLPHALYSLSKSFTSTAIGLAVAEGRLTVDDPVLQFFPDEAPSDPSPNLQAMRVRHLLAMNTGHQADTTPRVFGLRYLASWLGPGMRAEADRLVPGADENWPRAFLSLPVEHEPGTWFVYNTAATYMLSAIITKLTGQPLVEYLRPRLFEPLGIPDPFWETDPRGVNLGGTGLHLPLETIARFGQLYLQNGRWQGQQIVPEAWIAEATRATSDNSNTQTNPDWTVGYGYQFWRCRHDAYRGDGAFGQYCIVMPEQNAVLVINSGVRDMQAVLDKVWKHLLPAMQPSALPADTSTYQQLCDKLAALSLPAADGQPTSPAAARWSGQTYGLEQNGLGLERVALAFGDRQSTLTLQDGRGTHQLQIGAASWLSGTSHGRGRADEAVAASGAWTAADTYEVRVCCLEDAFSPILSFHFTPEGLELEINPNTAWDWDATGITQVTGRAVR